MNHQNHLNCAIVRDLLPLYHDDAVSGETGQEVRAHLEGCAECRAKLADISAALPEPTAVPDSGAGFRRVVQKQKKKRRGAVIAGFLAGAVLIAAGIHFLRTAQVMYYDANDITVRCVHHYQFDNCSYAAQHDPGADHGLFIWLKAPWIGNIDVTHENGVLAMDFRHPIWNVRTYGRELIESVYTVPVQPGDKVLKINGKEICEIGAPETDPPGYVFAEHALHFAGEDGMYNVTANTFEIMSNAAGGYTMWDISGKVLKSASDAKK